MTILVDVDGVIFNTQEMLLKWLNPRYLTKYTVKDITSYDWFDKTFDNPWEIMEHDTFWRTVKANKQAIDYILKWKSEGHIIKFVTASYYHHALPFKIHKLLDYFNGEFDDKDVIICHDKNMVRGDVLIDDCFDNVTAFRKKCNKQHGILYLQPWNIIRYLDPNNNLVGVDSWDILDNWIQFIASEK